MKLPAAVNLEGGSMRPLLREGKTVLVKKYTDYRAGDVVFYKSNGKRYIHRIIRKKENVFTVTDDAGICAPHRIGDGNIIGKVEGKLFSGFTGVLYCIIARAVFIALRPVKKIFLNHEVELYGFEKSRKGENERTKQ